MTKKIEYGDFQTPFELAQRVTDFLHLIYSDATAVLEPTCGQGAFLLASMKTWKCEAYHGFDINPVYVDFLKNKLANKNKCFLEVSNFFTKDWKQFFDQNPQKWLVIGNPPWVTNSTLGGLDSPNLPVKSNFQQHEGFAAKTGKANFDIAEWMLIKLIDSLQDSSACLAMLCKTATARKVLRYCWNKESAVYDTSIHKIDAAKYFDVSVDACLFVTMIGNSRRLQEAKVYADLSFDQQIGHIGLVKDELIADIDLYERYRHLDGDCRYGWRSGLKHDAAKVMELKEDKGGYRNGFQEHFELEDMYVFPLLKSSDIANRRLKPRRCVIVPQRNIGDDTSMIAGNAPHTWDYLQRYADRLDARKSIIYNKRPRFSIFGVGDYSFAPWKVAISGLYKNTVFTVIGQTNEKPIMLDDTCYFLPCETQKEAMLICDLLNSQPCQEFIRSLTFFDAKRPINLDLLKRIDLEALAKEQGCKRRFESVFEMKKTAFVNGSQALLFS